MTAGSLARLASGKCSVPWVKAPGMMIVVSMPNWLTSYRVVWASTSNADLEATYGPMNGGTSTVVVLPT